MAMSVVYATINGQIVSENRGGVISYYAPDNLGSTVALLDTTGTVTDTFTYWPYGEIQSHVGSSVTPFTFCGTLGYYTDVLGSQIYVRARYLRQALTRWLTSDALWPRQHAFAYVNGRPTSNTDPSGLQTAPPPPPNYPPVGPPPPLPITCGPGSPWNSWIYSYCNNCYYGRGAQPGCQTTCNYYASQYYNQCNAWKYPTWPPMGPPSGFQPVPGGGVIVPVRPCPIGHGDPGQPPTPPQCIAAGGGALDSTPPDVGACEDCCRKLGASTQGCIDEFNLWLLFHIGDGNR